jgi:hypothetical protein
MYTINIMFKHLTCKRGKKKVPNLFKIRNYNQVTFLLCCLHKYYAAAI